MQKRFANSEKKGPWGTRQSVLVGVGMMKAIRVLSALKCLFLKHPTVCMYLQMRMKWLPEIWKYGFHSSLSLSMVRCQLLQCMCKWMKSNARCSQKIVIRCCEHEFDPHHYTSRAKPESKPSRQPIHHDKLSLHSHTHAWISHAIHWDVNEWTLYTTCSDSHTAW